jgi:phage shock protein E
MTNSRQSRLVRIVLATVAVFALGGTVAGCSSDTSSSPASPSVSVTADTTLIDVRTPGEFASGHLDGAQNIDIQSATFDQQLAGLDKNASYVVYCRSGNRSADAVAQMKAAGFTNVQDVGGLNEASEATGVVIVK